MVNKVQLSFWDFFCCILTGFATLVCVTTHLLLKDIITLEMLQKIPSAIQLIFITLLLMLLGLLIEPFINFLDKIIKSSFQFSFDCLRIKPWKDKVNELEIKAKEYCPNNIDNNIFQYCKNWLLKHGEPSQYNTFLAKHGFYKQTLYLFLFNALTVGIIDERFWKNWLVITSFIIMAFINYYRSQVFYIHISETVYTQFIFNYHNIEPNKNDI